MSASDYRKRLEAALTAGDRWFADHVRVEDLRSLLSEAESLRADITGLEDGNMTWMCDQLDKAKAENAAQAVELERMREAWGFLAPRHYLSLQAVEADVEGEPMQWAVYRESGGRSTRVSQAATPLDAAMLARQALKAG